MAQHPYIHIKNPPRVLADYDDAVRAHRYPHPDRILVAMRLARDVETCKALLHGDPVDPDRLDKEQLGWAKNRGLVRLDLRAIDQLTQPHECAS